MQDSNRKRAQPSTTKRRKKRKRCFVCFLNLPQSSKPYWAVPGEAYTIPGDKVIFYNLLNFDIEFRFKKKSPFLKLKPKERHTVSENSMSKPFIVKEIGGTDIKRFQYVVHEMDKPANKVETFSDPDILVHP